MMKGMTKIGGLFLLAALLLALAACGEEKGPGAREGQEGQEGQGTASGEESGKPLELWLTTLGEEAETVSRVTEEIWNKEHPEMTVNVTVVPGNSDDFYQKLSAAFATENGPDMFCVSNAEMLKYIDAEIAYDVSEWLEPNRSDYRPGSLEAVTFDGKIAAFPGNMDIMGIYCNNAMFQEANISLPGTWEELLSAIDALATKDRYGIIVQTDVQSGYQVFEFYPFLWMCGGKVLDENGEAAFASEESRRAVEFYGKLLNAPGTCKKVENSNTDITPFGTERTAMQICGSWAVSQLAEKYPDLDYSVIPYPAPEEGLETSSVIGGWQYMVSAKGSNPEGAAEYLNWLWNSDIEIPMEAATKDAKISPRLSVMEAAADYYSQYPFQVFVEEILPTAQIEPSYPSGVVKAVGDALQDAAYSGKELDTILSDTQEKCQKAVK